MLMPSPLSRAHVKRTLVTLSTAALTLATIGTAHAGSIGFRTDAEVTAGPGVDVKVTMTHTGDEQADEVRVTAELEGRKIDGELVQKMQPGESRVWNFHLFDELARGVYAIVLRARYADTNGYPFEVVSIANVTNGVKAGQRIFGSLEVPSISVNGDGVASIVAKKPPERSGEYEAELVVPSGLETKPARIKLAFNEQGRATASFRLKNLKLLNGTNVNIYAFIRGTHENFPQVDTIRGNVRISAARSRVGPPKFYETAAVLFALLVILEGIAWATGRRREPA
jgi:hypothetical protein